MSDYSRSAEYYDLLHSAGKDYTAEAALLAGLIRERNPRASTILDIACGTGRHAAELATLGFAVDGIDLEPAFVAAATARNPRGRYGVADMATFDLATRYDAITCLFSSIGYVRTVDTLHKTLERIAAHLAPAGTVIIDPWFEPGQLTDHHVDASSHVGENVAVCRVTRTFVSGTLSRLEFDYLIARSESVDHRSETHTLGLFSETDMANAFGAAGLEIERRRGVLRKRGVYIGWKKP